jgi:predicted nucleotidyltransferase
MISRDDIRAFVDQVVRRFHPTRIILFGSYAYGEPTPDSDVDLLVVIQEITSKGIVLHEADDARVG